MKFNKTETKLLKRALRFRGRVTVETYHGRGAEGGSIKGGSRDRQAARKLVDKGLLKFVKLDESRWYNNGYCTFVSDILFELTDDGQKAAQEIA